MLGVDELLIDVGELRHVVDVADERGEDGVFRVGRVSRRLAVSAEEIGDDVVGSLDVTDVGSELRNVVELAQLTVMWTVELILQGVC